MRKITKDGKKDKSINAFDIIAREVRTQIMKNEETTTETILRDAKISCLRLFSFNINAFFNLQIKWKLVHLPLAYSLNYSLTH